MLHSAGVQALEQQMLHGNGLARVVRRLDNAIHRINHYPADSVVYFVSTYPLNIDLSAR